ncbi:hypothetical protein Goshw_012363, partial [Gossypium schwendimanii]|nr:hypothetical protein [Gossypium schwendimanii]
MQQEISKLQEELVRLDAKMNTKFQEFNDEFRGDLQTLLGQYFGQPTTGVTGKRKGVMGGAPPGFAPKEFVEPNASQVPVGACVFHLLIPSVASMHSSTSVRSISTSQTSSVTNALISKPTSRSISPTVMADRKQKGLCFWCGAKYHMGHKCVKPQLYQFLPEPMSDSEVEEFHVYSDQLEEVIPKDSLSKSHIISLHAITGSQGQNTIRCFPCFFLYFYFAKKRALEEKKLARDEANNAERSTMKSFQEKTAAVEVYSK